MRWTLRERCEAEVTPILCECEQRRENGGLYYNSIRIPMIERETYIHIYYTHMYIDKFARKYV